MVIPVVAKLGDRLARVLTGDCLPGRMDGKTYAALIEMGFKFVSGNEGDDLIHTQLPPGWRKVLGADFVTSRRVDIFDERNRNRAWCFIHPNSPAGPRDRTYALRRFAIERGNGSMLAGGEDDRSYFVFDRQAGQPVYPSDESRQVTIIEARTWLDDNHPDWHSFTACWGQD